MNTGRKGSSVGRRVACVALTSLMAFSFAAGNILAMTDKGGAAEASGRYDMVGFEDVTGKIDLSSVAIGNFNSSVLSGDAYASPLSGRHTFIVTLEGQTVLESKSEGQTASEYLATPAGARTLASIEKTQLDFLSSLAQAGVDFTLVNSYNTITNSVAVQADVSDIDAIKSVPSVKSVVFSSTYAFPESADNGGSTAVSNPSNVYATGIYDSSEFMSYSDGSGMTVAILDTGLDYTHEAFRVMPDTVGLTKNAVVEALNGGVFNAETLSEEKGVHISANDVYYSAKVPFAYDYADKDTDVYPSYSQHGTHVAGIVGGQADTYTDKDGNTAVDENGDPISFRGVAPNAQLVICKVFTDDLDSTDLGGATSEDILAALEDCVLLGVDIINMSLGTSAGFSSVAIDGDTEGAWMNEVYGSIKNQGINLICAASNDYSSGYGSAFGTNLAINPDSGTVGSPSTLTGAMSVASINGQLSRYMTVDASAAGASSAEAIYYTDASDANSVPYDFIGQMLGDQSTKRFKYVVIPGIGQVSDYTPTICGYLADKSEGPVIAVIKRGTSTFQDKVDIAERMGADAVIIYNNVAGTIRMSLGDLDDPVPAVSVDMDAGAILTSVGRIGYITLSKDYQAGPFMNDYSSWGATPDLKLKPDITSHGGEITSTVAGGYSEMSGTSMASPNLAGFVALLRGYLKTVNPTLSAVELTRLTNQITMSTATTVYDQNGLPYSPRKQGAGLATLSNVFSTNAYLYTLESEGGAEDDRPKIELGEDENKTGVYRLKFYVKNFGTQPLTFTTQSIFMTETLSSDGLSVAEKAYLLDDIPAQWSVGQSFTVAAGESKAIEVTLTLSAAEKAYIDKSFDNGMYVEGFLKLNAVNGEGEQTQCDLTLPFMGFYGDWDDAPMLDYDCYEIAAFQKDTSYTDETRPQAKVWATQAYSYYYNNYYSLPLGSFLYLQDENADQIYVDQEHAAISCFNDYFGEGETSNYITSVGIKAVYAGLLRNAEVVTYDIYNVDTGEYIVSGNKYRINKAYSGGGNAVPSQVLLEFLPEDFGLSGNGKYALDLHFYRTEADVSDPEKQDNTFSMVFYLDYEAPVLVDSRIRYYDYKEGNKEKQRVYLDLDIYDNHYAQAVLLCYSDSEEAEDGEVLNLNLATDYVTPVYNANKNGTTTVSIDVTDIIDKYKNNLWVEIDDYALNHSVYQLSFISSNQSVLPDTFEIVDDGEVTALNGGDMALTLGVNRTHKVSLSYQGSANPSNFTWSSSSQRVVKVYNGEIFGVAPGTATVTVTGANGQIRKIKVTVVDSGATLPLPSLSFGTIVNSTDALQKAQGSVSVNAGQRFKLELIADPWYYPVENLTVRWSSSDERYVSVDENGNVTTHDEKGTAIVKAVVLDANGNATLYSATVILNVQEPFTVSGNTLTDYHGSGGDVVIPADKNITTIGAEAFKDNDNVTSIVIPKTVTTINERAFLRCTALQAVYFVSRDPLAIPDSDLTLILHSAFEGCTSLKTVDFTNVKTITLDRNAFNGCTALENVVKMSTVGTMGDRAFYGCTSLLAADITGLHSAGTEVFSGCTSLASVETAEYTALGAAMFYGCTDLGGVVINTPSVGAYAFAGCALLTSVEFGSDDPEMQNVKFAASIGEYAFYRCSALRSVVFHGNAVAEIGDMAFAACSSLTSFDLSSADVVLGDKVFSGSNVDLSALQGADGAIYNGTVLLLAPAQITSAFAILPGTTEIAPYAFSDSTFVGATTVAIPESVVKIGEGAFAHTAITQISLPSALAEIADYTFYGAESLTSVVIPVSVTSIGTGAFEGCAALTEATFAANSALNSMGDAVFKNCKKLQSATLPDGVKSMGSETFFGCSALTEAVLPSVETMGAFTFWLCASLNRVTFGENAKTTGEYTFFPGADEGGTYTSSLTDVTLGAQTAEIGEGAFYFCSQLSGIDLRNATAVGAYAFANCAALASVTGLENLVAIGDMAFAECSSIASLNLAAAKSVGNGAFYVTSGAAYAEISVPSVETVGDFAFFGGRERTVELPATLASLGAGAFANATKLTAFTVAQGNDLFFAEDGVLYRNISDYTGGKTVYELVAYPSAKVGSTYRIKEGTVSVNAYAFAYRSSSAALGEVVVPYSVKTIGDGAFFSSGVGAYTFECVNAPTLLNQTFDNGILGYYFYYTNFEDAFYTHIDSSILLGPSVDISSFSPAQLTIRYPVNGQGYDNFVYGKYFSSKVVTAEVMDDTTRTVKEMIESFASEETVRGWNALAVNAENKAMVEAFSDSVKEAHRLLNTVVSQTQIDLLGSANVEKIAAIESELKAVKERFGIAVEAVSLSVSPDSACKTEYLVGEKFDLSGLKLIVTYDDYSTEVVGDTQISLAATYVDKPLTANNRYVEVTYGGKTVRVAISVTKPTEDEGGEGEVTSPEKPSQFNPVAVIVPVVAAALLLAAVGAFFAIRKFKAAKAGKADGNAQGGRNEEEALAQDEADGAAESAQSPTEEQDSERQEDEQDSEEDNDEQKD